MAWTAPFDPFEALGVSRDASPAAIKSRYRELARRYHPNRHQGSDEQKAALVDYFHHVHQAWRLLSKPESRRRYLELLQLLETQNAVLAGMADLLKATDDPHHHHEPASHDGHISSDADDDRLPHPGRTHRRTTLEKAMSSGKHLNELPDAMDTVGRTGSLRRRIDAHDSALSLSIKESESRDNDYFAQRRKRLEKLRWKELQAFYRYRDAMVAKFDAELEADRCREKYDLAIWKRDYFERAPRETADRLRSFQHAMSALRAFGQRPAKRARRLTLADGGQILSTDGPDEASRYLDADNITSPSRAKSSHRRGMSSDISGDQTSSDDASSGGYSTPRSAVSWISHPRHGRNVSLDAFQTAVRPLASVLQPPTHSRGSPTRVTVPKHEFHLVIKQPTGMLGDGLPDAQDSSASSPSTSSRTASPLPSPLPPARSMSMFTIVPSSGVGELLGCVPAPGVSRARSDVVHPSQPQQTAGPSAFLIKEVTRPEHDHIPIQHVHLLHQNEKQMFLSVNADTEADPDGLMRRLRALDNKVAGKLMVKPDIMEIFNFRLIYNHRAVVKNQHQSFIALSYRRSKQVVRQHGCYSLPLEPEMFQAVWDERLSDTEGLWCDQVCIDQLSDEEKTISMSAMDMVYRSARLAVVVLDDIQLEYDEGSVLEDHMNEYERMHHVAPTKRFRRKQPPWLESREDMYNVLIKIFSSSWFRRAWCRHEMRLAREHVFLIPCLSSDDTGKHRVVRFTGRVLAHLLALSTEVGFGPEIELVKPALHSFFRDRSHLTPEEKSLHSHHGNFTTVVAEVFAMETGGDPNIPASQRKADAMKDKISIILNTMECGLSLAPAMRDPEMLITKSECHYMLLMLALAAQDPGALCTVGPPMRMNQELEALSPTASTTWLFEPTNVDAGLNNYRTLNRMPADALITTHVELDEHVIQLDLKLLNPGKISRPHEDAADSLVLARRFFDACEATPAKHGRNRRRYLVKDVAANHHFGDMREVYIETLACVFECGPDWMEEICHRYGVSRWKQCLQPAYELLIALQNTCGRWPATAWNNTATGFVLDFVNFIIIRGLPQRQILHREAWRPLWVATGNGGKVLAFVPRGSGVRTAVPVALLDADYIHLARLWVLQPREQSGVSFAPTHDAEQQRRADDPPTDCWTLLGKTVLFSDDRAIQQLHSRAGIEMTQQQKVFGREDPDVQRAIRERGWSHF